MGRFSFRICACFYGGYAQTDRFGQNWFFKLFARHPITAAYFRSLCSTCSGARYLESFVNGVRARSRLGYSIGSRKNHRYHAAIGFTSPEDRNIARELEPFVACSCNPCRRTCSGKSHEVSNFGKCAVDVAGNSKRRTTTGHSI